LVFCLSEVQVQFSQILYLRNQRDTLGVLDNRTCQRMGVLKEVIKTHHRMQYSIYRHKKDESAQQTVTDLEKTQRGYRET